MRHGRGCVYSLQYHLVWCVKYRRKVLMGEVESVLKRTLQEIALQNNVLIEEMQTDLDHIHLLISCTPQHSLPLIIKAFKGTSARRLFEACPYLKRHLWGGHLWNPSYFVATVSANSNTEAQVRTYIKNQQVKPR